MQYTAEIKSLRNDTIKILITTPAEGEPQELILSGDEPVTIDYQADSLFKPLKMSGCSVTVLSKEPLLDIYTGKLNDVSLHVWLNDELVWFGYLTPNVYTSAYQNVYDELTLEFVDALSAMENVKYKRTANGQFKTFRQFFDEALQSVGSTFTLAMLDETDERIGKLDTLGCMERNFIDETDEDDNAMTYQEVIEEICRYLQLQAVMYGNRLLLIDPFAEQESMQLEKIGLADGAANISLGSVYNRLTVIENTNPIDDVLDTEALEDRNMESAMIESLDAYGRKYWDSQVQAFSVPMEYDGTQYTDLRAMYRPKAESGWWMLGDKDIDGIADPETNHLADNSVKDWLHNPIDKGAFALYTCNYDNANIPAKLSWQKQIVMFCDRAPLKVSGEVDSKSKYYEGIQNEPFINYNKSNHALVMKDGYLVLALKYKYMTAPMTQLEMQNYGGWNSEIANFREKYNYWCRIEAMKLDPTGKDKFRVKLRIGDKYWNGTAWTQTECFFEVTHTWKGSENIYGTEAALDNTNTYRLGLSEDIEGLAIPIGDMALYGDIEFALCPPSYMGKGWVLVDVKWEDPMPEPSYIYYPLEDPCCCCMITDLKLAYCTQLSSEAGMVLDTDTKNTDIKVTGTADVENLMDMDDIEMKVNTWSELQNSYSYVIERDEAGDMRYHIPTPKPEVLLINRMIDYYSQPMLQYEGKIKNLKEKPIMPWSHISIAALGRQFAVCGVTYDLQMNSAAVQLKQLE